MEKRITIFNENDLSRIEKDRQEINAAYDNGYSFETLDSDINLNTLSDYNDLHDRIDKYGFIHHSKLPPQLTETELKRNNIEKLREIKWNSMLKDWNKHYIPGKQKFSEKLVSRIFKGIPNSIRTVAWFKLLEIDSQIKAQYGIYEKMKNFARKYSLELRQIDLDINRTFRNNYTYKKRYCQRQRQLYNVLAAYSVYNTEIGYCQGMSTLTALLLMYLSDEEKTFWALSQLMSNIKYNMHGFFKSGFPKLIRYSDKHEMIIKIFLPKLHKKFIKCNITPLIYTTKWFLQCYLDALPFSLVLRVWDVYLLKGDITILAMSYCILKMHKRTLLQKEFDMDKINEFLNHKLPENFLFEDDFVIQKLNECIEKLIRFKFETGSILEPIPQNELPNIPFGDFKRLDNQELLNKLVENSTKKNSIDEDRNEQLKQLAASRLEAEKKRREEKKNKKLEEKKLLNEKQSKDSLNDDMKNEPLTNIETDEDSDNNYNINEDSDDDLNPSKISEYDDDKVDKESMLSNLTRQSSPQRSNNSFEIKNFLKTRNSGSNSSFANQTSDYENLNPSLNNINNTFNKTNLIKIKAENSNYSDSNLVSESPNSLKFSKQQIQQLNINTKTASTSTSVISPQIISPSYRLNPSSKSNVSTKPIIALNANTNNNISNKNNVTKIKTNSDYYLTDNKNVLSPRITEYVRGPHGIYTRVNVPPFNYKTNTQIPQSTSSLLLSTGYQSNNSKRTASLRSVQKNQFNQNLDLLNNSSSNNINTNSYISPNKQHRQLQKHSLRIANIHQQQNQYNNITNFANISIISQVPKQSNQNTSNSEINQVKSNFLTVTPKSYVINKQLQNKSDNTNQFIEQYDYI